MVTFPEEGTDPVTPHEAALRYASLNFRVVPIGIGKKWPELPAWQQHATSDPTTIDSWWGGLYKGHGVGLLMGVDGVFAVDVDVAHGHDGMDTLKDLEDSYHPLPDTVTAQTPSGGAHFLFRAPPGVTIRNNQSGRLGPGLDIRGEGGQIVVAPTQRDDGRAYVWVWERAPWEHPIADAPGWLIALLTKDEPCETSSETPTSGSPSASRSSLSAPSSPSSDSSRPGDRFNAATTWPTLLEADGWTRTRDGPEGEQRWVRPGKDAKDGISATVGWKGSDVLKVFTSSVPTLQADATYSRFGYWAATRHASDHRAAAGTLAAAQRAEDINGIVGVWTPPQTSQTDQTTAGQTPQTVNPYLASLLDWHALFRREPRELESWDGHGLLIKGRHTALVAKGGEGKSLLAIDIVARIATLELAKILYVDWEMGEDDVYSRAINLGHSPTALEGRLEYAHLPIAAGLDGTAGAALLIEAVRAVEAQIVVLDTYSRAVDGEENDADTVRSLYKNFSLPLRAMGVDQFRLDHLGKDRDKGARGSSAKNDDVDQVWQLTAAGHGVNLTLTKNRANSNVRELHYLRRDNPLRHECVDEPIAQDINTRLLADLERLGPLPGLTRDQLTAFLKGHGVAPGDTNKVLPTYLLYAAKQDQTKALSVCPSSGPDEDPDGRR